MVNVDQENLDSFLAIAEELQLKGLRGTDEDINLKERELNRKPAQMEPKPISPGKQKMPHSRRIPKRKAWSLSQLETMH